MKLFFMLSVRVFLYFWGSLSHESLASIVSAVMIRVSSRVTVEAKGGIDASVSCCWRGAVAGVGGTTAGL